MNLLDLFLQIGRQYRPRCPHGYYKKDDCRFCAELDKGGKENEGD